MNHLLLLLASSLLLQQQAAASHDGASSSGSSSSGGGGSRAASAAAADDSDPPPTEWNGADSCWAAGSRWPRGSPRFHLMNQGGCGIGDVIAPVFDPVHGVFHHFDNHQAQCGHGQPGNCNGWGHFVSKDFVTWAPMPMAIINGKDIPTGRATPYDSFSIFTGSASVVDDAGPGGKPGVVLIFPGICDKEHWPACNTSGQMSPNNGVLLGQAVPADYSDPLLTNWSVRPQ
jgi:hypothetical protein